MDERRLLKALEEYSRLEDEFVALTEYIPLETDLSAPNYQFPSPKAAVFGIECGTWLETFMKDLLNDPRLDDYPGIEELRQKGTFDACREPFVKKLGWWKGAGWPLKDLGGEEVLPFRSWAEGKNPEWFRTYSRLKHDRIALQQTFTMGDALNMFVALTVTVQHWPKPKSWRVRQSRILEGVIY